MGFFSELKEDLSQAVNELMPEEGEGSQPEGQAPIETDVMAQEPTAVISEPAPEPAAILPEDLDAILAELEEVQNQSNLVQEEKTVKHTAEEPVNSVQEEPVQYTKEEPVKYTREEPKREVKKEVRKESFMMSENRMANDETAVITKGMVINGDMLTEGSIELVGTINGNIEALGKLNITGVINGNSKASEIYAEGAKINGEVTSEGPAKIGQSSVIIGNITATSAVIAGAVKGDIDVKGPVILDASAIVMGNIRSKSVQINNGAVIEGMCSQCYADVNPTSFFKEFNELKKANQKSK